MTDKNKIRFRFNLVSYSDIGQSDDSLKLNVNHSLDISQDDEADTTTVSALRELFEQVARSMFDIYIKSRGLNSDSPMSELLLPVHMQQANAIVAAYKDTQ